MKKYTHINTKSVPLGKNFKSPTGRLVVNLNGVGTLYSYNGEGYCIVGTDTKFSLTHAEHLEFQVRGPKNLEVFVKIEDRSKINNRDEVFTNIDRRPEVSEQIQEILRAGREQQLIFDSQMRELKLERKKYHEEEFEEESEEKSEEESEEKSEENHEENENAK